MGRRAKPFVTLAALAIAAGVLGACGVHGPLDPPIQAGAAGENSAAKPKPHEDFILDPLLR
jgi:predicted small lipoprotein YifL